MEEEFKDVLYDYLYNNEEMNDKDCFAFFSGIYLSFGLEKQKEYLNTNTLLKKCGFFSSGFSKNKMNNINESVDKVLDIIFRKKKNSYDEEIKYIRNVFLPTSGKEEYDFESFENNQDDDSLIMNIKTIVESKKKDASSEKNMMQYFIIGYLLYYSKKSSNFQFIYDYILTSNDVSDINNDYVLGTRIGQIFNNLLYNQHKVFETDSLSKSMLFYNNNPSYDNLIRMMNSMFIISFKLLSIQNEYNTIYDWETYLLIYITLVKKSSSLNKDPKSIICGIVDKITSDKYEGLNMEENESVKPYDVGISVGNLYGKLTNIEFEIFKTSRTKKELINIISKPKNDDYVYLLYPLCHTFIKLYIKDPKNKFIYGIIKDLYSVFEFCKNQGMKIYYNNIDILLNVMIGFNNGEYSYSINTLNK